MFHGPRFAGVTGIGSVADDGITGTLRSMPARGALLDSAGQLIGHWMQVSRTVDQTVLPTGIDRVTMYGPQPPLGSELACTAWIREVSETEMRADAELRDEKGRLWCRIEGWTTRRFATDEAIWQVKFRPETATLSRPRPGGWSVVWERWPDSASRELMMRSYLNAAERARYSELNPLAQRQWLLGRIAIKDAVRRWLWDRGAGPDLPGGDHRRQRRVGPSLVRGPFRAPRVSVAHCAPSGRGRGRACAVAAAGDTPLGIDVEPATAMGQRNRGRRTDPHRASAARPARPGRCRGRGQGGMVRTTLDRQGGCRKGGRYRTGRAATGLRGAAGRGRWPGTPPNSSSRRPTAAPTGWPAT